MKKSGFTLVEILTVILIIGILATVGVYGYNAALIRSRDSQRITDLQFIRNGLEQFYLDNRSYPVYQADSNLPMASWQLESGFGCQNPTKKYLAPKYLSKVPQDPARPFILNSSRASCSADSFGRYLYFGLPKDTSKTGYYLLARLERSQSVNFTQAVSNDLSQYTGLPTFCDAAQFSTNPNGCSQNYFVTNTKNN